MNAPNLHVLFVDDEQAILDGLRNSLRKERKRWEMTFALGGQQALEEMKKTPCRRRHHRHAHAGHGWRRTAASHPA
jgi:CheY-like chemotaxis protein